MKYGKLQDNRYQSWDAHLVPLPQRDVFLCSILVWGRDLGRVDM